ncbi:hypothetical protein CTI14_06825 [Methylobacterium radiotolerans]|nr:hypothetical protein CTI14_06825 [Methylobacterium radiotolerans]
MSAPLLPSGPAGNGTDPREIIYLDRGRLFSYASQLHDGLTLLRRVLSSDEAGKIISKLEREHTVTEGETKQGSAGVSAGLSVNGQYEKKSEESTTLKTGGDLDVSLAATTLMEDKAEMDNLFLLVEQELTERGLIRDFDGTHRGGLVRIQSAMKIADNGMIASVFQHIEALSTLKTDAGALDVFTDLSAGPEIAALFRAVVPGTFVAYLNARNRIIMAPLNDQHLAISPGQLRAAFTTKSYVVTMLAFVPQPSAQPVLLPGMLGTMDFAGMLGGFTGEADVTVVPIAIYASLK